jgi:hypothetical protein
MCNKVIKIYTFCGHLGRTEGDSCHSKFCTAELMEDEVPGHCPECSNALRSAEMYARDEEESERRAKEQKTKKGAKST